MNWLRQLIQPDQRAGKQEAALIEAARHGDRQAFDTLVRLHERLLRGFLTRRIGQDAVDDVLQDTWLAGWQGLPNLTQRTHFKAWLFGIAQHKCTDYYRTRGRIATEALLHETVPAGLASRDLYAQAELKETVRTLLMQLPEMQRDVLELYYYEELTLAEIAAVLGRNLNTVKYQFYRAHALAAQSLSEAAQKDNR